MIWDLPFDNPKHTYVAVTADSGKSRLSLYGSVWWLGYRNNKPTELIKSRFETKTGALGAYRDELRWLLAHCETHSTIYLPRVFYRYTDKMEKDFMLHLKKAEIILRPPSVLWDIVDWAVKDDLNQMLESVENKTCQYLDVSQ